MWRKPKPRAEALGSLLFFGLLSPCPWKQSPVLGIVCGTGSVGGLLFLFVACLQVSLTVVAICDDVSVQTEPVILPSSCLSGVFLVVTRFLTKAR